MYNNGRLQQGFAYNRCVLVQVQLKPFTTQSQLLTTLKEELFENIMGKGENAGHQHFLLFPQCFQPFLKQI